MNKKLSQKKNILKNSNTVIAKYRGALSRFMMDCGFPSSPSNFLALFPFTNGCNKSSLTI